VIDFTSALYLGFRHSSRDLPPWPALTSGKPAVLWEPEWARRVGQETARLQGCEAGLVSTSTLHLFWDALGWLARRGCHVYLDGSAYPIAQWGAERAAGLGAGITRFRHYDANDLEKLLRSPVPRPVVVADGFCPSCGRVAPLRDFLDSVRRRHGLLVVDDTQGLGILGTGWELSTSYGKGGGGSLCAAGLHEEDDVIAISSLAKAFGAPIAVLTGPARLVRAFEDASETRVHSSPPSMAVAAAALRALARNRVEGERLRVRLASLVGRLRSRLGRCIENHGLFPVQTVADRRASEWHARLAARGIHSVLRGRARPSAITFMVTAAHQVSEIEILSEQFQAISEATCFA
jgi:8-amino-7-oxononanoate synthase